MTLFDRFGRQICTVRKKLHKAFVCPKRDYVKSVCRGCNIFTHGVLCKTLCRMCKTVEKSGGAIFAQPVRRAAYFLHGSAAGRLLSGRKGSIILHYVNDQSEKTVEKIENTAHPADFRLTPHASSHAPVPVSAVEVTKFRGADCSMKSPVREILFLNRKQEAEDAGKGRNLRRQHRTAEIAQE